MTSFAVCINDSDSSGHAVQKVLPVLLRNESHVVFLSVLPKGTELLPTEHTQAGGASPSSSIPSPLSGIVDAAAELRESYEDTARATLAHAMGFAEQVVKEKCLQNVRIETAILPGLGGASGVAESIAMFCEEKGVEFVVLGSRALGAVGRFAYSLVGSGSVSDWLAKNSSLSLLVVGPPPTSGGLADEDLRLLDNDLRVLSLRDREALGRGGPSVLVGMDATSASRDALNEALRLAGPDGVLHVVSCGEALPSVDAYLAQLTAELTESGCVRTGPAAASGSDVHGPGPYLVTSALPSVGGPMDVEMRTREYCLNRAVDLRVMGWGGPETKGHGALASSLLKTIGMGSTAEYALHHPSSEVPTLLVRRFHGEALLKQAHQVHGGVGKGHVVPLISREEEISALPAGAQEAQDLSRELEEERGLALGELMPAESLRPAGRDTVVMNLTISRSPDHGRVAAGAREAFGRAPETEENKRSPGGATVGTVEAQGAEVGIGAGGESEHVSSHTRELLEGLKPTTFDLGESAALEREQSKEGAISKAIGEEGEKVGPESESVEFMGDVGSELGLTSSPVRRVEAAELAPPPLERSAPVGKAPVTEMAPAGPDVESEGAGAVKGPEGKDEADAFVAGTVAL